MDPQQDKSLHAFRAIISFIDDCKIVKVSQEQMVKLDTYKRLLKITAVSNTQTIKYHINIFKTFLDANHKALESLNINDIACEHIVYSRKNKDNEINIKNMLDDNKTAANDIWIHLLTINLLVAPPSEYPRALKLYKDGKARLEQNGKINMLEKIAQQTGPSKEEQLLNKMFKKIETHLNPETNPEIAEQPMQAALGLLKSGAMEEILVDIQDGFQKGELSLEDLMSNVQKMMSSAASQAGVEQGNIPDMSNILNMANSILPK